MVKWSHFIDLTFQGSEVETVKLSQALDGKGHGYISDFMADTFNVS